MASRSKFSLALAAVVVGGAVAACGIGGCGIGGNGAPPGTGGGQNESDLPPVAKDPKLAAQVPKAVAADGLFTIANDQTYPPNEFVENGKLVGMDVDLGRAIAQKLGLTAQYVNSSFDGILGGITANKYEAGMSSFSVNAERLQQVTMVSYYVAGTSLAGPTGNPDGLDLNNLCGRTIAVQKGSTQVEDLQARSKECNQRGKPAVSMSQFQAQTDVTLAVSAGRAEGELGDSPTIDYAIKQTAGQLQRIGRPYANAPYGVAMGKNQTQLARAVQGAVQSLIDDGTYLRILTRWGVESGAVKKSEVNPTVED